MSGNEGASIALTRRGFLKGAGATASVLGLAGVAGMTSAGGWLAPAKAQAEVDEHVAYTFHQNHCTGHCSLKCTVRDGRLCNIEPNDKLTKRYATVCRRGISEIQHVYSSERIQTPLKRTGERGSGEFMQVSWDEAIQTIKEEVEKIWDKYGHDAMVVAGTSDVKVRYPHLQKLMGAQNDGRTGIDLGNGNGYGPMFGQVSNYTVGTADSRDWVDAKTIILTSTNYLETSLVTAKTFFEAKEAGADITVIDTQFSTTASKAHRWIPIEPGTDGALFLGMITHIIDNGWQDEETMKKATSFPYLVNSETGALIRQGEVTKVDEPGSSNPFLVWDAAKGEAVSYLECDDPELEGEFVVEGQTVTTVFELLKKSQKEHGYTVAWASEKTTIPEETIKDLAYRYACVKPATLSFGWGGSNNYLNSDIAGAAMGIIAALTGNFNKPGASIGVHIGGVYNGFSASLASWPLSATAKAATQEMASYRMRTESKKVHGYIAMGDMFQQHYANMNVTREWLKSLDFVAYIDIYHCDSANWADIVLPACSKFEATEEVQSLKSGYSHLLMQGKVLDPLFESKPDFEIEKLIATALGFGDAMPPSAYELCKYQIEHSTDKKLEGYTLEQLIDNQGVYLLPGTDTVNRAFESRIKKTISGRVDVYNEKFISVGQQLPVYEDPDEVYADNELRKKYPLQFASGRTKYHIHSMFCDASWIRSIYDAYMDMNPADMEPRGLADGDVAEVFNDRGSIKIKVRENNAIRPGSPRVYEGNWSKYIVEGNAQDLTNDKLSPREEVLSMGTSIPWQDCLVEVRKA